MDSFGGLLGGPWLNACTTARPKMVKDDDDDDLIVFDGAPKDHKMRAAVFHDYGEPSELTAQKLYLPIELEATEVLVEVHSAGVNHIDCQLRKGLLQSTYPLALPAVLGVDLSGVVRKVGPKVKAFQEGDAVFGRQTLQRLVRGRGGAYAEYCVVDASDIHIKPSNITHDQAASMPTAALAACAALTMSGLPRVDKQNEVGNRGGGGTSSRPPPRVVICGASGGVGAAAVQLAKVCHGAFVVAVCGGNHTALVRELGADEVVDRTVPDWPTTAVARFRDFDLVVDCVGLDEYWEVFGRQVLGGSGRYVSLNTLRADAAAAVAQDGGSGGSGGGGVVDQLLRAKSKVLDLGGGMFSGFRLLSPAGGDLRSADLAAVAGLLRDGRLRATVDGSPRPLAEAAAAQARCESLRAAGRVVLTVRQVPPWERLSVQGYELDPAGPAVPRPSVPREEAGAAARGGGGGRRAPGFDPRARFDSPRAVVRPDSPEELPPGWESAKDPEGVVYYYNRELVVSQYEHPGPAGEPAAGCTVWTEVDDPAAAAAVAAAVATGAHQRTPAAADGGVAGGGRRADLLGHGGAVAGGRGTPVVEVEDEDDIETSDSDDEVDPEQEYSNAAVRGGGGGSGGGRDGGARFAEEGSNGRPGPAVTRSAAAAAAPSPSDQTAAAAAAAAGHCGLGVMMKLNDQGRYYVGRLEPGGSAERSGRVRPGDVVLEVDGCPAQGLTYPQLATLIRGPRGTSVKLTLLDPSDGSTRKVILERSPIEPTATGGGTSPAAGPLPPGGEPQAPSMPLRTAEAEAEARRVRELAREEEERKRHKLAQARLRADAEQRTAPPPGRPSPLQAARGVAAAPVEAEARALATEEARARAAEAEYVRLAQESRRREEERRRQEEGRRLQAEREEQDRLRAAEAERARAAAAADAERRALEEKDAAEQRRLAALYHAQQEEQRRAQERRRVQEEEARHARPPPQQQQPYEPPQRGLDMGGTRVIAPSGGAGSASGQESSPPKNDPGSSGPKVLSHAPFFGVCEVREHPDRTSIRQLPSVDPRISAAASAGNNAAALAAASAAAAAAATAAANAAGVGYQNGGGGGELGGRGNNAARLTTMHEVDQALSAQVLAQAKQAQAQRLADAQLQQARPHEQQQPPPPLQQQQQQMQMQQQQMQQQQQGGQEAATHQQPPAVDVSGRPGKGGARRNNAARLTAMFDVDAAMIGSSAAAMLEAQAATDPRVAGSLQAQGNRV